MGALYASGRSLFLFSSSPPFSPRLFSSSHHCPLFFSLQAVFLPGPWSSHVANEIIWWMKYYSGGGNVCYQPNHGSPWCYLYTVIHPIHDSQGSGSESAELVRKITSQFFSIFWQKELKLKIGLVDMFARCYCLYNKTIGLVDKGFNTLWWPGVNGVKGY